MPRGPRGEKRPADVIIDKKEVFASDTPGCAHRKIAELGRLIGCIPALHGALEGLRPLLLAVTLEPFGLDLAAAQWGWGLLIMAGEVVFADGPPDAVKGATERRQTRQVDFRSWFISGSERARPSGIAPGTVIMLTG